MALRLKQCIQCIKVEFVSKMSLEEESTFGDPIRAFYIKVAEDKECCMKGCSNQVIVHMKH